MSVRRLSDIRSPCGADATLQHLLETTTAKLELCGRLAVNEYEAQVEGHETIAAAFRELAIAENQACCALLRHLRRHLEKTIDLAAPAPSAPEARELRR